MKEITKVGLVFGFIFILITIAAISSQIDWERILNPDKQTTVNYIPITGKIHDGQILYEPFLGKCVVLYVDAENIMVGFYDLPRNNDYLPRGQKVLILICDKNGRYVDPIRPYKFQIVANKVYR